MIFEYIFFTLRKTYRSINQYLIFILNFQSFENDATFCGIGGAWDAPFPWKTFKKRDWFQAAVIVVSLGVRYLEKIIPGYRNCEQNFINEYIGRYDVFRDHI